LGTTAGASASEGFGVFVAVLAIMLLSPFERYVVEFCGEDVFGDGWLGLRINISLMLLRLSNSGINRPDSGSRNFVV
jgi:hypothetical protein